jgi:hypothetical protein
VSWLARKPETHARIEHSIGVRKIGPAHGRTGARLQPNPSGDELDGTATSKSELGSSVQQPTRLHHSGASPMKAVFLPGDKRVEIR